MGFFVYNFIENSIYISFKIIIFVILDCQI